MRRYSSPITPRDGQKLRVIPIARISTLKQDEKSLDDQLALMKGEVGKQYEGDIEYTNIATQGSGEKLDREELTLLEEYIESNQYDLVIAEDLARICRRIQAVYICELCEDHGTRLIAINDNVDTAHENWSDGALMCAWHHERSNKDTSKRIKRTHRNRFKLGAKQSEYGPFYTVPDGAKMVDEVKKKEAAIEIVKQGFSMLEMGLAYQEIADWLNELSFPVGGQSKRESWNGRLVKTRFLNPILKGVEERNNKKNVRINSTGHYKQVSSDPDEVLPFS
ncbi:recombinase family protein [uncultured Rubinisphaera sp.]|uniref:recombinase family protein n=1 Tax=uncultured Rubinisphaera sp. TaxID=1678686 RepID=UPI000EC29563|nr:hypothetical protein [Planctomycetaceae bacterium]|tara:strand:- start:992 stop:1828 length:837 start_codon:yes stop_codon:yes gene_type:complete